jgi:proline iminopeptidase
LIFLQNRENPVPPIGGSLDVSGYKFNYLVDGAGPIIVVPGSCLYDQRAFSPSLREQFRFIFLDHRGFVPPPFGKHEDAEYDLKVILDDLEKCRKIFGIDEFFIMGHSGHALIALEYAKRFPQFIRGVIMVACAPNNSDERRKITNEAFEKNASPERKQRFEQNMERLPEKLTADPSNRFRHFLDAAAPQGWHDFDYDASPLWKDVYTNMQAIDHIWGRELRDLDITKGLDLFKAPVLMLLGRHDYLTGPPSVWDAYRSKFKRLEVDIFEQSAHCPQIEEVEKFNRAIRVFISALQVV